jgi:histidinol-phosphatase (PHP family)
MLCHLDGALRFVPETSLTDTHHRMIDRLLQTVRDKGMALEINTFGVTLRHQPFPTEQIVSLALAYRIPLVLGSDAHSPANVGRHFSDITRFILSPREIHLLLSPLKRARKRVPLYWG